MSLINAVKSISFEDVAGNPIPTTPDGAGGIAITLPSPADLAAVQAAINAVAAAERHPISVNGAVTNQNNVGGTATLHLEIPMNSGPPLVADIDVSSLEEVQEIAALQAQITALAANERHITSVTGVLANQNNIGGPARIDISFGMNVGSPLTFSLDVSTLEDVMSAAQIVAALNTLPAGAAVTLGTAPSAMQFLALDGTQRTLQIPATSNTLTSAANTMTNVTDGVPASAPIINSNALAVNAAGALTSTVNGVASNVLPLPDFWRSATGAVLPNGVTDLTDEIWHDGTVRLGDVTAMVTNIAKADDVNLTPELQIGGAPNPGILLHSTANAVDEGGYIAFRELDTTFGINLTHSTSGPNFEGPEGLSVEAVNGGRNGVTVPGVTKFAHFSQDRMNVGIGVSRFVDNPNAELHVVEDTPSGPTYAAPEPAGAGTATRDWQQLIETCQVSAASTANIPSLGMFRQFPKAVHGINNNALGPVIDFGLHRGANVNTQRFVQASLRSNSANGVSSFDLFTRSGCSIGDPETGTLAMNFRFEGAGTALKTGGGLWAAISDERAKADIKPYRPRGLALIAKIAPLLRTYVYKDDTSKRAHIGFIAQTLEKVEGAREWVSVGNGTIDGKSVNDFRTLDVTPMLYEMVAAIAELSERVAKLESQLATR